MNTPTQMSRRRFLAIVGGVSGTVGVAGFAGWRALAPVERSSPAVSADEGVLTVEVESGFVDAASWRDDLLTLRPAADSPEGVMLRAELSGIEHQVETPDGFAARCIGTVGDTVVVCGHRVIETGQMEFEAGTDYRTLIAEAGYVSDILRDQPSFPHTGDGYRHVFVEYFASIIATSDMTSWRSLDLRPVSGRGGSFGAILNRDGILAADSYAIAEIPDSVFESTLISLTDAVAGVTTISREAVPLDHGSLWGSSNDGNNDLLIVSDREGTRGYDHRGGIAFDVDAGSELLGVNPRRTGLEITVELADGSRQARRFNDGVHMATMMLPDEGSVKHRVSLDVTIAAPHGRNSLVPNSKIAHLEDV